MNTSHEIKLKEEYNVVKSEILLFTEGRWQPFYFLRHILCFLRQHTELCKQSDYKELYDETITLLILHAHAEDGWTTSEPLDQQGYIELLTDLKNRNANEYYEAFSVEIIDDYLAFRKRLWNQGKKHAKSKYGFIS